jgi:hypothetical protein
MRNRVLALVRRPARPRQCVGTVGWKLIPASQDIDLYGLFRFLQELFVAAFVAIAAQTNIPTGPMRIN